MSDMLHMLMFLSKADWGKSPLPFMEKVYFWRKSNPPIIPPLGYAKPSFICLACRFSFFLKLFALSMYWGRAADIADCFGSWGSLTVHGVWRHASLALAHTLCPLPVLVVAWPCRAPFRSLTGSKPLFLHLPICWFSKIKWLTKRVGESQR